MRKNLLHFVFCIALITLILVVLPSYASETVTGDVITVIKLEDGDTLTSESIADGGFYNLRVQEVANEVEAKVVKIFTTLSLRRNRIFVLLHSNTKSTESLIRELINIPDVISASPNHIFDRQSFIVQQDPLCSMADFWGLKAINVPRTWLLGNGNRDVYVAVIDTGVDSSHSDLKDNFEKKGYSRRFYTDAIQPAPSRSNPQISVHEDNNYIDEYGHGTHVAGTIGAVGNNNIGLAGVTWKTQIIALNVDSVAAIASAFEYLINLVENGLNLSAVNLSMGYYEDYAPYDASGKDNNLLWVAMSELSMLNKTVICVSAGNEGLSVGEPAPRGGHLWWDIFHWYDIKKDFSKGDYAYPASFRDIDNMIVVAAANNDNNYSKASFSNYSTTYVDVTAPGVDIWSTMSRNHDAKFDNAENYKRMQDDSGSIYSTMSGTSMAAPHVTGTAVLLKSLCSDATAQDIKTAIKRGANSNYATEYVSNGLLDAEGAMKYLVANIENVSINDTNFPDEKFRTYIKRFDMNNDAMLSKQERSQVTTIDVSNLGISSMQGIEYFRNIDRLDCSGNDIASLYVSGHSKLNYLNVSNCKSLTTLLCSDNVIFTINLLGCTILKELYCENNVISMLNISECTELTTLSCANNPLMKLDVSKCTKLTSLSCEENYLTTLDLSVCPALTDVNMRNQTYVGLKVTGNANSYKIDLKDYMTQAQLNNVRASAIIGYNANGSSISASSMSYNTNTGIIDFKEKPSKVTYLYDTNPSKNLRSFLMQVTLKEATEMPIIAVDLTETNFPDASFRSYLSKFDRNGNGTLDYDELQYITNIEISATQNVTNLEGIKNFISLKTITGHFPSMKMLDLSGLTSLTNVNVYSNNLETLNLSGCTSLISFSAPSGLKSLNISGCTSIKRLEFTSGVMKLSEDYSDYAFIGVLSELTNLDASGCTSLKTLRVKGKQPYVNANGCINLQELYARGSSALELKGCTALEILDCGESNISELDLSEATELKYLECSSTNISELDISNCKALISLDCSMNSLSKIEVNGAFSLKELKYICFQGDMLGNLDLTGCSELVKLYVSGSSLKSINLSECKKLEEIYCFGNENLTTLNNLGDCGNLLKINCSNNNLNTIYLRNCKKLEELDCSSNSLAVLDLSKCSALKKLDCDNQVLKEFKITDTQSDSYRYRFDFRVSLPVVKIDNIARVEGVSNHFFKDGSVTFSEVPKEIRYTYKTGYHETVMNVKLIVSSTLVTQPTLKNYVLKYGNQNYTSTAYNDFEDVDFSTGREIWTTIEEKTISSGNFDWTNAVVGALDSSYGDDGALSPYYDVNNSSIIGKLDLFGSIVRMIHGFVTGGWQGITDVKMKLQENGSKNRMLLMYGTPIESYYSGQTLTLSSILIKAHSGEMAYFLHAGDDADKVIRSIFKGLNEGGKYDMWITFSKADDYKNSPYRYSIVIGEDGKVYQYPIIHNNTKFEVYYQPENGDSSFAFDATALIASEKIVVKDQVGSDILSFLRTISDVAPSIATTQLSTGSVGRTYQETLTSSGTTPITWSIESNKLPDGLSLNKTTGQITGIPKTANSFTFTVKAHNSVGSDTKEFTIKIDPAPVKPSITTGYLPNGTVGTPYEENISFTGTEPITWSIINGKLPDNLALVNGRISGRPSRVGTYTFMVQASNRAGSDTKAFTIKISDSSNDEDYDDYISDERAEKLRNLPIFTNLGSSTPVQRLSSENATLNYDRQLPQEWNNDENETVLVVLPEIRVYSDGIYVINVPFEEYVSSGTTMIWHAFSDNTATVSFYKSANDDDECAFLDDDDNEVTMPTQKALDHVNIAAYFEAYKTYTPVITAYAGTDDNNSNDNDVDRDHNDEDNTNTNDKNGGSGGGGCNSTALGIATLFFVAVLKSKKFNC